MADTHQTSWTNLTVDLLRNNPHVDCRPIWKLLVPKTQKVGIRFISQQAKVTEGVRGVRLDAWYYIRQVGVDDILKAVSEAGFANAALNKEIRESMAHQKFYHVFIRGNDPDFMPLGVPDGQDIVTTYCCERVGLIHEEVDKYLFDDLNDPQAISLAMSDPIFDHMLEQHFRGGDIQGEETLHVVSRFRGGNNLLHTCIKEGYLESLRLLLDKYTSESHRHARWRVLAEPLRPFGLYKVTAFHRAVYDGQAQCLEELLFWAQRHGHDITDLRNVEERNLEGETLRGLSCLELAEQEKNFACYNILAPLFGVAFKEGGIDANRREVRLALRMISRVDLSHTRDDTPLQTIELNEMHWCNVIGAVKQVRNGYGSDDVSQLVVRLHGIIFTSDATEKQLDELLAETGGMMSVEACGCKMKSDWTGLHSLRVVIKRLASSGAHIPHHMPHKVHISSDVTDELDSQHEATIDAEVAKLLSAFAQLSGKWPGFLGARNGLISLKQRRRLASSNDCATRAATVAATYTTRLSCFLGYDHFDEHDAGLGLWIRHRELMPLARAVFKNFYNLEGLLSAEFQYPGRALDPAVVHFLQMTLSAWFVTVPQDPQDGSVDVWRLWAERLQADEEVVKKQLAPAVDLVLHSLLRMWNVLNPACQDPKAKGANITSISHLVKTVVPEPLLSRLPRTQSRLERHPPVTPAPRSRASILDMPVSLRPEGWPGAGHKALKTLKH